MLNCTIWNRTVYMYNTDLALNNLKWLICHKTKPNSKIDLVVEGFGSIHTYVFYIFYFIFIYQYSPHVNEREQKFSIYVFLNQDQKLAVKRLAEFTYAF